MRSTRSVRGRLVSSASVVLAMAIAACGGKFDRGAENTAGTAGTGASGAGAGGAGAGGASGASGRGGNGGISGSAGVSGRGGTGGVAGSGAGGSGAVTPCVQGGVCRGEGMVCSEDSCCPCQYRCTGGRWQVYACPSCPAPFCPDSPPANGSPCDSCFTPMNGCTFEGCPAAPRVFARCDGDRWSVQAVPCSNGCCAEDAQCGQGFICASTVCKPSVSDGCWRDAECGPNDFCSGAFVCPCNADCAYQDTMGQCVPKNGDCCRNDSGCMTGYECVAGMCKSKLAAGLCWSDRDCFGTSCRNAQVCPCGTSCLVPDVSGTCG